jgi:hypothetical protein
VSYLKIQVFRLYPDSILTGDNQKHHWQPKKFLRWALKLREWINDGAQLGTKLEILLHVFPKIPADHPPNFVMLIFGKMSVPNRVHLVVVHFLVKMSDLIKIIKKLIKPYEGMFGRFG